MKYGLPKQLSISGVPAAVAMFIFLAIFFLDLTPSVSALDNVTLIKQILANALPQASELTKNVHWTKLTERVGGEEQTDISANRSWTGKRQVVCYNPITKKNQIETDGFYVDCDLHYRQGDSGYYKSAEMHRTEMLKILNKQGYTPYPDLPGAIINYEIKDSSSPNQFKQVSIFCHIRFYRSEHCIGDVKVRQNISEYHFMQCQPRFDTRVNEAKSYVRSECERLAKLIYTRLPEGKVGTMGRVPPVVPPAGTPSAEIQPGQVPSPMPPISPSGTNRLPDSALPIAAGATAAVALLGAWLTLFAQGIPPKEALGELVGLFKGERRPSSTKAEEILFPDTDQTPGLTSEEGLKEEIEYRRAWENFREDVRKYEYKSADFEGDQMEKVRAEMAAEAAGRLGDLEQVKIDDYIDLRAPDEETARKMKEMVDKMTVKTGDGKVIGDFGDIMRELNYIVQQSNRPELTYLERYSIRDEIMDNAKLYGEVRGYGQDAAGVVGGLTEETKLKDLSVIGERAGDVKVGDIAPLLDGVGKVSEFIGYVEGYRGAGDSVGYALVKAGVQMGIKQVAFRNPVVGLTDTAFKYATQATLGYDASPSKALEFQMNMLFDVASGDKAAVHFNPATGQYETGAGAVVNIESPEITERVASSLLSSIEKQLENPNLSAGDRQELLSKQQELLLTLSILREK